MTSPWRLRIASLTIVWLGVVVALALMDMRPSVTVLAAIAVVVATVIWLLLDVGDVAEPVDWRGFSDGGVSVRGSDARVRALHRQISDVRALDGGVTLQRSLVDLIDAGLRDVHGIDRLQQPDAAARVLGARLSQFVATSSPAGVVDDPARLSSLLDEIERCCTDPHHQEVR